jgi:hypothetical protein
MESVDAVFSRIVKSKKFKKAYSSIGGVGVSISGGRGGKGFIAQRMRV